MTYVPEALVPVNIIDTTVDNSSFNLDIKIFSSIKGKNSTLARLKANYIDLTINLIDTIVVKDPILKYYKVINSLDKAIELRLKELVLLRLIKEEEESFNVSKI